MNKSTFKKMIKEEIKNLSTEEQVKVLKELKENIPSWTDELLSQSLKDKWLCKHCKKYSNVKKVKQISRKEIREGVCVYTDAGYGDDDEFADVEYLVNYRICPLCKKESYKDKMFIREFNRRGR